MLRKMVKTLKALAIAAAAICDQRPGTRRTLKLGFVFVTGMLSQPVTSALRMNVLMAIAFVVALMLFVLLLASRLNEYLLGEAEKLNRE